MRIQTLMGIYRVICTLEGTSDGKTYLCSMDGKPDNERFVVQGLFDPGLREKLSVFLMDLSNSENESGFVESFLWNDGVWCVFRCVDGTPWSEWVKGELPMEERFDAASELMARIFASQLPTYLQYEGLNLKNIVRSRQEGICIWYLFHEPQNLEANVRMEVQERVACRMEELFLEACGGDSPELNRFLDSLRNVEFESDGELYGAYRRFEEALRLEMAGGGREKMSALLRLWKWIFAQWTNVLQFFYCLAVGALCGIFLYVCIVPSPVSGERIRYDSIGTLRIIPYGPIPEPGSETEETEETETEETEETETEESEETETAEPESETEETETPYHPELG